MLGKPEFQPISIQYQSNIIPLKIAEETGARTNFISKERLKSETLQRAISCRKERFSATYFVILGLRVFKRAFEVNLVLKNSRWELNRSQNPISILRIIQGERPVQVAANECFDNGKSETVALGVFETVGKRLSVIQNRDLHIFPN